MLWTNRAFKLEVNGSTLKGYSAEKLELPSNLVEETPPTAQVHAKSPQRPKPEPLKWVKDQHNKGYGWRVKTFLLQAQGYGTQWRDCWVPKRPIRQPRSPLLDANQSSQSLGGFPNPNL